MHISQARLKPPGLAGRKVVDQNITTWMTDRDPPAIGTEARGPSAPDWAWLSHRNLVLIDVPDGQGNSGTIGRRQVAAVGAEAEDEDVVIAARPEAGNFLVVGHPPNKDCSGMEP